MRKFKINVNGNSYEVEVEEVGVDSKSNLASKPVLKPEIKPEAQETKATKADLKTESKEEILASGEQEAVESPMPGNISKLMVNEGDIVNEGDVLLILEAMKMENEIMAPKSGKIVAVNTTEGSTVNTGDKIVILE